MPSSGDAQLFSNISASTGAFRLNGGVYNVAVIATSWSSGSVDLQVLGPDGSTWINVLVPFTTNGFAILSLAGGQYQFSVSSASGVYVSVAYVVG